MINFFCLLLIIVENTIAAVDDVDQEATDGVQFLKKVVYGTKANNKPGYLLFTAPYKLCQGKCKQSNNFELAFPIFVGKHGKSQYQNMFKRDFNRIHLAKSEAPFKYRTTRRPYTLCPTLTTANIRAMTPPDTTVQTTLTTPNVTETTTKANTTTTLTTTTEAPTNRTEAVTNSTLVPTNATEATNSTTQETDNGTSTLILELVLETVTTLPALISGEVAIATEYFTEPPPIEETISEVDAVIEVVTDDEKLTTPIYDVNSSTGPTIVNIFTENPVDAGGVTCPSILGMCMKKRRKSLGKVLVLMLLSGYNQAANEQFWKTSGSKALQGSKYNGRKSYPQQLPFITPQIVCHCPPAKECPVEYNLNEDALAFLNILGIYSNKDVERLKKFKTNEETRRSQISAYVKKRRSSDPDSSDECCCAPQKLLMPTFITEKQFNKSLSRMSGQDLRKRRRKMYYYQ